MQVVRYHSTSLPRVILDENQREAFSGGVLGGMLCSHARLCWAVPTSPKHFTGLGSVGIASVLAVRPRV